MPTGKEAREVERDTPEKRPNAVGPIAKQIESRELLHEAVVQWGEDAQVLKAIEEMSELTRELAREPYTDNNLTEIQDEIADVWILLEQLTILYGESEVENQMAEKLDVLESKLNGGSP
jgi:NTP pyrophosphatase (non-canonical NTP hydrolase)